MKKYFIYILLFCLTGLILSLRSYYHSKEIDKVSFIAETQVKLDRELQKIETDKEKWLSYFLKNKSLDFESLNKINTTYPFFIFKNTSLVYWSNSHFEPTSTSKREVGWHFVSNEVGQYLEYTIKSNSGDISLISVIPLFEYYDVNNEYIQSGYNTDILPPSGIYLHQDVSEDSFSIKDLEGNPIFHISLASDFEYYHVLLHYLIIFLELTLAAVLIYLFWIFSSKRKNVLVRIVSFSIGVVLLWWLMDFFDFPFHSKDLDIFAPKLFASSDFNSSLGYLLINCLLFFALGYFTLKQFSQYLFQSNRNSNFIRIGVNLISYFITLSVFYLIYLIYVHSSWGFDSTHSIDFSVFQLLSVAIVLLFGFLVFQTFKFAHYFNSLNKLNTFQFISLQILCFGVFSTVAFAFGYSIVGIGITVFILNSIIYFAKLGDTFQNINFLSFIYLFLLVTAISIIASISVQELEKRNELKTRNILADKILNGNDVLAEYLLRKLDESLQKDEYIRRQFLMPFTPYRTIAEKINKYYLSDYFEKYEKSVKIFDASGNSIYPNSSLPMSASYPIQQMNDRTRRGDINLYLVGNNEGNQLQRKYIYVFEVKHYDYVFANIVLELKPKKIRPDNVFPELLVKNRNLPTFLDIPYDYALYKNDTLSYSVGNLNFPNAVDSNITEDKQLRKIQETGNFKFSFVVDNNEKLIFSKENKFWYRFFSNISFFFILCFVLVFIVSAFQFIKLYWETRTIGLSAKIQLYFSLAFLVPLLSVSVSTLGFVNATFLNDIVAKYEESTNRVSSQLVPLLMDYESGIVDKATLNNEISTITKIINADINLYDLNGQLFLTSQPEVFEKNLLSYKINPAAYASIFQNGQKMVTLEEQIGNLNYQSAYVGIRSYNSGELLAILGSPFFKSNKEYDTLLTDLLNNVFNIFVACFIIFIFLAYAATKILTSPLNLLKKKLSQVNLSAENKPISWLVDDEIGLLIKEYNQMLLKLEKSRQALRKTEKESAWREMAQQVAHEIKNPLTPMKLSLQHLQMKIQRSEHPMPDASEKINSILSQIENLSDIATSFSSFAQMPIPENEIICITDILKRVVDFFHTESPIISLDLPNEDVYVLADPKIIERTFNNMLINAMQSGADHKTIQINLKVELLESKIRISIADNGLGIPEDNYNKVFLPNFTTKSTGSGIGLAVAKRGIEHAGGDIWFESKPNEGTTFYIELKRLKSL